MTPSRPSTVARGGRALYGVPLGILMLEARFPRIPGDMGNGTTWPFPVLYHVVRGASPEKVVLHGARGLLPDFIAGAKELVRLGAEAITTNCGFLSLYQKELAAAAGVPVATSALMQVPWVQATLPPGRRVGVVTISASTLTRAHLEAAGVPPDTPVAGTENGLEFFRVLVKAEKDDMDVALAERDVVDAGKALVARHPEVGAIVLECTNMPPYAAALQAETGLPVYDIYSMITWFHAGLRPRAFDLRGRTLIKAVFFDYDGVLTTDNTGSLTTARYLSQATGVELSTVKAAFSRYSKDLALGKTTRSQIWPELCSMLGHELSISLLYEAFESTPMNAGMFSLARKLKKSHSVGIITDNTKDRIDHLKQYQDLESLFSPIVVSAEAGVDKRSTAIFLLALRYAGVSAEEAIFVDNNKDNLVAPGALGIETIFHDDEKNDIDALVKTFKTLGVLAGDA